jgi:hypothetical protein
MPITLVQNTSNFTCERKSIIILEMCYVKNGGTLKLIWITFYLL